MIRRKFQIFVVVLVVALVKTHIGGLAFQPAVEDSSTGAWFIELDSSVAAFRARAKESGVTFSERFVFNRLWRGVSVQATRDAASMLGRLAGVKAVFPVVTMTVDPVEAASPELIHALVMTGADVAQNALGLSGAGIKVGVIDTGIDYDHPDLGGGFGPGRRVATGFDFVGDRYDAGASGGALIPHPDSRPDDCNGHGTHVAGIIGASGVPNVADPTTGGARGVAPDVTFGAYRVFGCAGSTSSDIMIAAMERALADGMDVVNMSIGAAFQTWPQYPTAVAADALVDAGVVVVASIGNSGASGIYSAGAPGVGRKVLGVASFDNSHVELPAFLVSPDGLAVGYFSATGAAATPTTGSAPFSRTGTPTTTNDACSAGSPPVAGSLTGTIALIRRGTCSFYEKSLNAQNAGAIGVVLYNNAAGFLTPTVAPPAGAPAITIPVVFITQTDGATIDGRIATGTTTLTWTDEHATYVNPTGGRASSFTAWGLSAELALKPNLGAPGGLIRSTWTLEAGGYATISGTSMSSPHVAGAVALFLQAHPDATPKAVKTALQNSSDPVPFSTTTFRDPVHRQGAGMLDIDEAITATASVTPPELSLGEDTIVKTRTLAIANNSGSPIEYTLTHQAALTTAGSTFAPGLNTAAATVGFAPSSVTVPAGGTASVAVTITPPPATMTPSRSVYGGSLVVTGGGGTYRVPYAGFTGDYQTIQVLAPGGCTLVPFPAIFKRGGETVCVAATATAPAVKLDRPFTPQAAGATFNVEDSNDRPVILYHRAHQSRRLEIRAVDAVTGAEHLVAFADYVTRNASNGFSFDAGAFSTYTWDGKKLFTNSAGKVQRNALPDGPYKLEIKVTKALADPNNPAHTETWTSPTFLITRY